jgi:hypothetical protein
MDCYFSQNRTGVSGAIDLKKKVATAIAIADWVANL